MEEERIKERPVPFLVHDYEMARWERILKRIITVFTIITLALCAIIALLLYDRMSYDYSEVLVDAGEGNAAYMGDYANGVINNGENSSQKKETEKPQEVERHSNESGN